MRQKPISSIQQRDRYYLPFPEGMRDNLKAQARKNKRSLNAEIVYRLGFSLHEEPFASGQKENGSAEAATSPSHGSRIPNQEKTVNGHDDTTARLPAARAMTFEDCPVFAMVEDLNNVRSQRFIMDEAGDTLRKDDGAKAACFERSAAHWLEVETAFRGVIAASEAYSVIGACIQTIEALRQVDLLEEIASDTRSPVAADQSCGALRRLLFSIFNVLENHSEFPPNEVLDAAFWERHCDPWNTRGQIDALAPAVERGA